MIKTKYKKREKYPDTFGELPLTGLLPSRDSEIRVAIAKVNRFNKSFTHTLNNISYQYNVEEQILKDA